MEKANPTHTLLKKAGDKSYANLKTEIDEETIKSVKNYKLAGKS